MKAHMWSYSYSSIVSLTSVLDGVSTHCTGGWVGPTAGLEGCGKSRPPTGLDPQIVQPVSSRYRRKIKKSILFWHLLVPTRNSVRLMYDMVLGILATVFFCIVVRSWMHCSRRLILQTLVFNRS